MDLRSGVALWVLCGFLLQQGRGERPPGSHLDETAIAGESGPPAGTPPPRSLRAVPAFPQASLPPASQRIRAGVEASSPGGLGAGLLRPGAASRVRALPAGLGSVLRLFPGLLDKWCC